MAAEPSASGPDNERQRRRVAWTRQFALVMELPFVLVGSVLISGFLGYLLDGWLKTRPWLMIVLGAVGFYAGLREVLRRLPKARNEGGDRS